MRTQSTFITVLLLLLLVPSLGRAMSSSNFTSQAGYFSNGSKITASASDNFTLSTTVGQAVLPSLGTIDSQRRVVPVILALVGITPPTVYTLETGSLTPNASLPVSGYVSLLPPPQSLKINGVNVAWDATGHYSTDVPLVPGDNTILVTATNQNNVATGQSRVITYEAQAPRVSFTSPANNSSISISQSLLVRGTAGSGATVALKVNGVPQTIVFAGGSFSATLTNLLKGENSIVATAAVGGVSSSAILLVTGLAADSGTGDINNDGLVDIVDALLALRHDAGVIKLNADEVRRCDLAPTNNPNGVCDIIDAYVILRKVVGL